MAEDRLKSIVDRVYGRIAAKYRRLGRSDSPNYVVVSTLVRRFVENNPDRDIEEVDWAETWDPRLTGLGQQLRAFREAYPMYRWGPAGGEREAEKEEERTQREQKKREMREQVEEIAEKLGELAPPELAEWVSEAQEKLFNIEELAQRYVDLKAEVEELRERAAASISPEAARRLEAELGRMRRRIDELTRERGELELRLRRAEEMVRTQQALGAAPPETVRELVETTRELRKAVAELPRMDEIRLEIDSIRTEVKRLQEMAAAAAVAGPPTPPAPPAPAKPAPPTYRARRGIPYVADPITDYWFVPLDERVEWARLYLPKWVWGLRPDVRLQLMLWPIIQVDPLTYFFNPGRIANNIIGLRTVEEIDALVRDVRNNESLRDVLMARIRAGRLHKTDFIAWGLEEIWDRLNLSEA